MKDIPDSVIEFFESNSAFEYDISSSIVGNVELLSSKNLDVTTLTFSPRGTPCIDDPYEIFEELDAHYKIRAIDLVGKSENYCAEGILAWFPDKRCFGQYDCEHETIFLFKSVEWEQIVADPVKFLDHQWTQEPLPVWLEFPLAITKLNCQLPVYGNRCEIHRESIAEHQGELDSLQRITIALNARNWVEKQETTFPFSGVPVSESRLIYCASCRSLNNKWVRKIKKDEQPIAVKANASGYVKCPLCSRSFPITSRQYFRNGMHVNCGQKIVIVSNT